MAYANQIKWRKNTAILHVRKAFQDNFMTPGDGGNDHGNK
jgi:hypothetical protein